MFDEQSRVFFKGREGRKRDVVSPLWHELGVWPRTSQWPSLGFRILTQMPVHLQWPFFHSNHPSQWDLHGSGEPMPAAQRGLPASFSDTSAESPVLEDKLSRQGEGSPLFI